jgi:hypothetical protein
VLDGYRSAGVDRAIIILRSEPAEQVAKTVADITDRLKSSFL